MIRVVRPEGTNMVYGVGELSESDGEQIRMMRRVDTAETTRAGNNVIKSDLETEVAAASTAQRLREGYFQPPRRPSESYPEHTHCSERHYGRL